MDCLDLKKYCIEKDVDTIKQEKHTIVSFSIVSELAKDRL